MANGIGVDNYRAALYSNLTGKGTLEIAKQELERQGALTPEDREQFNRQIQRFNSSQTLGKMAEGFNKAGAGTIGLNTGEAVLPPAKPEFQQAQLAALQGAANPDAGKPSVFDPVMAAIGGGLGEAAKRTLALGASVNPLVAAANTYEVGKTLYDNSYFPKLAPDEGATAQAIKHATDAQGWVTEKAGRFLLPESLSATTDWLANQQRKLGEKAVQEAGPIQGQTYSSMAAARPSPAAAAAKAATGGGTAPGVPALPTPGQAAPGAATAPGTATAPKPGDEDKVPVAGTTDEENKGPVDIGTGLPIPEGRGSVRIRVMRDGKPMWIDYAKDERLQKGDNTNAAAFPALDEGRVPSSSMTDAKSADRPLRQSEIDAINAKNWMQRQEYETQKLREIAKDPQGYLGQAQLFEHNFNLNAPLMSPDVQQAFKESLKRYQNAQLLWQTDALPRMMAIPGLKQALDSGMPLEQIFKDYPIDHRSRAIWIEMQKLLMAWPQFADPLAADRMKQTGRHLPTDLVIPRPNSDLGFAGGR